MDFLIRVIVLMTDVAVFVPAILVGLLTSGWRPALLSGAVAYPCIVAIKLPGVMHVSEALGLSRSNIIEFLAAAMVAFTLIVSMLIGARRLASALR